jgi:hypothetical protein
MLDRYGVESDRASHVGKAALSRSVPKLAIPSAFISSSTNASEPLLDTTTVTGSYCRRSVSSSSITGGS